MPRASAMYADTVTKPVPIGRHTISITFRPDALTPELIAEAEERYPENSVDRLVAMIGGIRERRPGEDGREVEVELFAAPLTAWDVTDDEDQVYPITEVTLAQRGMRLLNAIFKVMMDEVSPPASTPAGSSRNGRAGSR